MNLMRAMRGWPLCLVGLASHVAFSDPNVSYQLVDLGELTPGGPSVARDINNAGVIVGSANTPTSILGYVWERGRMRPLELPASYEVAEPVAINDRGQIVGHVSAQLRPARAALWFVQTGGFSDLYPDDPWMSYALGINAQGVVVGEASLRDPFVTFRLPVRFPGPVRYGTLLDPPETTGAATAINAAGLAVGWVRRESPPLFDQPFVFTNRMIPLPLLPLGSPRGQALSINDAGQSVGWSLSENAVERAVHWPRSDTIVVLPQPPQDFIGTRAYDINNVGQIVGGGSPGSGFGAVLWQDGQLIDLNTFVPAGSPLFLMEARAINDVGQIVGLALNLQTFTFRSFLLEPSDRDQDGLFDTWETAGIDVDADGVVDLDLPALGANPDEKDIFVEIDAMENLGPTVPQLDHAVRAFASAPADAVQNANGSAGINLHPIIDDTDVPVFGPTDLEFADLHLVKSMYFGTAAERSSPNAASILKAKTLAFHYCLFVNEMARPSVLGVGELPGNDFIVALGGGWPQKVQDDPTLSDFADMLPAAVFMHELGHNLGLGHGGRDPHADVHDDDQFKPNYRSLMNYKWTVPNNWNYEDWRLDYSRTALFTLDENNLNELAGAGGDARVFVEAFDPNGAKNWFPEGGPADFNGNEAIDLPDPNAPLRVDLNRDERDPNGAYVPKFSALRGREDWSALVFRRSAQWIANFTYRVSDDADFTPDNILSDFILPGDITGNCRVDLADVARLMPNFGIVAGATVIDGDLSGDGAVSFDDVTLLLWRLGRDCSP